MAQVSSTSSGLVIIEKLEGANNYNNWKFVMKMSLIMDNLWACVEGTETDENKNQKALAKICLNVHPSCFVHVREATNAKDAWTNLQKAFENTGLCRRLALLRKLLRSKYEDFRNMDEYISAVMSLVQQLADINHNVDDEEVAMIILGGLPSEFDPLIMGIEATHTTISTEMVKSRLLQDDYRRGSLENTSSESALAARKVEVSTTKRSEPICFHCGKKGHIKPKCKYFKKGQKKKYLSNDDKYQKQNDNQNDNVLLTTALFTTTFGERDWIIDSGCTMHMTKNRDWLSKFENNSRNVTVANNQTIQGIGMGQVNIKLDNAGAGTITDVMYVPDISANLLSVNKLTEKNLTVVFDKDQSFALIPSELRKKLDAKSAPYIMVGYCDDSKGYRLLDLKNPGKIVRSRDVIFLENLNDNVEKQEEMSEPQIIPENSQIFFDHLNVNNDSMEVKDSSEDEHSTGSEYIPSADDNSSSTISPEESENEVQGEVENRNERPVRGTRNKIPERLEDYELSFYTDLMPIDDEPKTYKECMQDIARSVFRLSWKIAVLVLL
ncbi:hypothetical protein QE152_g27663 [Popillia japonica]|uniref:CCHC-type domain-containing protein n=1 Tax=Popillia japonica TaxID=7064 RepID=A0AAW1JT91_POPJA